MRYAAIDLAAEPPACEDALYHFQQAAEKALKAFLVFHDEPFPKTHDLGRSGKQAVHLDAGLDALVDGVVEITKYAWMFRYPGNVPAPTLVETLDVSGRVTAFVDALASRVLGDM
ncbi:MAG: HEPN domain-containing protein [Bryobacterales bacterium]|nr:HEPN domain-containing protein [Bryobacterales bacterium]